MTKTKFDRLQARVRNSWAGVALLVGLVALTTLAQFGDAATKVSGWFRAAPAVDLLVQDVSVEPLAPDAPVQGAGPDALYGLGAKVRFHVRHDLQGRGMIGIRALTLDVLSHDPAAACPFTATGDGIYGAGPTPVRVFKVRLAKGRVDDVRVKLFADKPLFRGSNPNLLDLEPPYEWELTDEGKEQDDPLEVRVFLTDAGRYELALSLRYSTPTDVHTRQIATLHVCRRDAQ